MAKLKTKLTASNIKYLLAMYQLSGGNTGMRCVRIAELLKITKPSVHAMINTLRDMGLVRKNLYGEVFFTDEGVCLAARYDEYYTAISGLFRAYLSDDGDICSAACAVLAEVSAEGLASFCKSTLCRN